MASCSVFLNVSDLDKSLEFYQGLGFRASAQHGRGGGIRWADLDLDGAEVGLGDIRSNPDPAFRAWVGTPLGAGVVVYLTVDDVDAVHERARAMGATIEAPLEDRSYGRVFTLNDPDGYTVTFLQEAPPAKPKPRKAARPGGAARAGPGAKPGVRSKAGAKARGKAGGRAGSKGGGKRAGGGTRGRSAGRASRRGR